MESGNVSTGEQRQLPTVFETTNGSYQQPPAAATTSRSRKRGIAAVLQDTTNFVDKPKPRRASQQARRTMQKHISPCAPRGDPMQGAAKKYRNKDLSSAVQEPVPQLGDKAVSNTIADTMQTYVQRNASHEILLH